MLLRIKTVKTAKPRISAVALYKHYQEMHKLKMQLPEGRHKICISEFWTQSHGDIFNAFPNSIWV